MLLSHIDTIVRYQNEVDRKLVYKDAIRKNFEGRNCTLIPLFQCYLYRDTARQYGGGFVVGARLQIDDYQFYWCLEPNPSTGKYASFWVGGRDRIEADSFMDKDLGYHLANLLDPINYKDWIIQYIANA